MATKLLKSLLKYGPAIKKGTFLFAASLKGFVWSVAYKISILLLILYSNLISAILGTILRKGNSKIKLYYK